MRLLPIIFAAPLTVSTGAYAARVVVEAPCEETPWLDAVRTGDAGESVGAVTVSALTDAAFPFVGSDAGFASIRGTVTGDAALELLGDAEMRAYGWCFSLNGVEPAAMPDRVAVPDDAAELRWYFGFAHYKNGVWLSYCTRTNQAKPAFVCD